MTSLKQLSGAAVALMAAAMLAACDAGQSGTTPPSGSLAPPPVPDAMSADSMHWTWSEGNLEGWTQASLAVDLDWPEGGGIGVLAPPEPAQPDIAFRSPPLSFSGGEFSRIRVDLETLVPGVQPDLSIYYATTQHGEAFEYRGAPIDGSLPEPGEPRVLIYDMSRLASGGSDWVNSTITSVRFDLPQGANSHHIIRALRICRADDPACAIPQPQAAAPAEPAEDETAD